MLRRELGLSKVGRNMLWHYSSSDPYRGSTNDFSAQEKDMGQPIGHLEIMGKDAQRLHAFYAELFDWKVGEASGPELGFYAQVAGDSSGLPVGIGQEPGGSTRTTAYVQVPDLQATLDQAVALGGKVVVPPTEIPGVVTFAQFTDPEGNLIGLTK